MLKQKLLAAAAAFLAFQLLAPGHTAPPREAAAAAGQAPGAPTPAPHRAEAAGAVPAPESVLGFKPGDDRKLASWAQVVDYFRRLDAASDRVRFEELGRTTLGAPFVAATISAPENLARLGVFRDIQRRLADPRTLGLASAWYAR